MSTETENRSTINEDEVVGRSGAKAWRFASGLICRGSEEAGTLEVRDKIAGNLRRFGVYDKTFEGGTRVCQLEADIENSTGTVRIKASMIDMDNKERASGVLIGLAWGLLQLAKDEGCIFTAGKSREKNKYGSYSTFVNVFTLPEGAKQGREVPRRPKSDDDMDTVFESLLKELKAHPAWADRSVTEDKDGDGDPLTHLAAFCGECEAKGWPTPEQLTGPWLAVMGAALKQPPKSSLSSHSDDDWGQLRQILMERKDAPKLIKEAMAAATTKAMGDIE